MSWLYSRALVEGYSAASYSDGEQCAPSNMTNMPAMYLSQGKTTEASNLSRYGMMCEPLTENRGEAALMSFLEAFPVKISVAQEKVLESQESKVDSGKRWRGLLVRHNQDMFSSKTVLCSEQEDYQRFSKTLAKSGTMQSGVCWERGMPEGIVGATECGYLPSPCASDGTHHGKEKYIANSREKRALLGKQPPTEKLTYVWHEADIPISLFPIMHEDAMMWPLGWTDLKPLETDKFQQWRQQHS